MKKACRNGHPYTPQNTYESRGKRYCRTCRRAASKRLAEERLSWRRDPGLAAVREALRVVGVDRLAEGKAL